MIIKSFSLMPIMDFYQLQEKEKSQDMNMQKLIINNG